jgi:pimeloyl-ACP methyl ester carboxylesterase
MPKATANGIELEYDEHGRPDDPVILLIMGLSAQMTSWDEAFVSELAGRGFRVIRFDNRDIGLSTFLDDAGVPDLAAAAATGEIPAPPYTLADMAADAAGLLDGLGVDQAHVVGASMGGMIAQTFAIAYPERTLTLTSIFANTGAPDVGQPHAEVAEALFLAGPAVDREAAVAAGIAGARLIGSPGFPFDETAARQRAERDFDRSYHPAGVARQALAVVLQADRTDDLRKVSVPTLVVHGDSDPLVDVSGGRATAAAIPGAELWIVPGMAHDLPPVLYRELAERIAANCRKG